MVVWLLVLSVRHGGVGTVVVRTGDAVRPDAAARAVVAFERRGAGVVDAAADGLRFAHVERGDVRDVDLLVDARQLRERAELGQLRVVRDREAALDRRRWRGLHL